MAEPSRRIRADERRSPRRAGKAGGKQAVQSASARSRQTDKAKAAAATAGIGKAARVSVPAVPEVPASAGALSRRASAIRLGLLTTTLALLVGNLIRSTEAPMPSPSEPTQALSSSATPFGPADPLA